MAYMAKYLREFKHIDNLCSMPSFSKLFCGRHFVLLLLAVNVSWYQISIKNIVLLKYVFNFISDCIV